MSSGDGFSVVARALAAWPDIEVERGEAEEGCQQRLIDALRSGQGRDYPAGVLDRAGLLLQVLGQESARTGVTASIRSPRADGWPTVEQWHDWGVQALPSGDGHIQVTHEPWKPKWLGLDDGDPAPACVVLRGESRRGSARRTEQVDSYVAETFRNRDGTSRFRWFVSPGQRQAIRSIMAAPEGSTLLVNLPTGTGKSLVAILPSILWSKALGVSVIVVPTTTLALDQERSARNLAWNTDIQLPERLAYYGDQSPEERQGIRDRIRDGTQRIVITSPEGLVSTLYPALHRAASRGYLRLIAIDEAHIVSQWGAEFRPQFQMLAGVRHELLAVSEAGKRPRTLAMSATMTEETVDTLSTLYGKPGPLQIVSAVGLRPEPEYWSARCSDNDQRKERVFEAVLRLPRPLILYASRVADVKRYYRDLREAGFGRVAIVHGATSSRDRIEAIRAWRGDPREGDDDARTDVDIVVATSAFGLGVDQSDVRTVVHACIPETIDRYYQEVGRGGRDGRPCLSMLLWTEEDRRTARGLCQRKIISVERGYERWMKLWNMPVQRDLDGDTHRLNLRVRVADLTRDTDENQNWNVRTLTLMSRAGLIQVVADPPPTRDEDEDDKSWEERLNRSYAERRSQVLVRLLDGGTNDPEIWACAVRPQRQLSINADRRAMELMEEVLYGKRDVADILYDTYALEIERCEQRHTVRPERACGGCAWCREQRQEPYAGAVPPAMPRGQVTAIPVNDSFADGQIYTVFYSKKDAMPNWERGVARRAIEEAVLCRGVRNLVGPDEIHDWESTRGLYRSVQESFLFRYNFGDLIKMKLMPYRTLIVVPPSKEAYRLERAWYQVSPSTPTRIVVAPDDALHPAHASERAVRLIPHQKSLSEFLGGH